MGMSRKDYQSAAEIIANAMKWADEKTPVRRQETLNTLREVAGGLASMFGRDNGRFDRDKFMTACGLGTVPDAKKHNIKRGDVLYLYGERVKVAKVISNQVFRIVSASDSINSDDCQTVRLDQLNY